MVAVASARGAPLSDGLTRTLAPPPPHHLTYVFSLPSNGISMNLPIALALIVIGIVLLIAGLGSADSIQNAFSRLFSGHLDDRTMWAIVGGCICAADGLVGCYRCKRA